MTPVLAAVALVAAGAAAPGAAPRAPGTATVVYVTAARAYLDAGGEDGLAPGDAVTLVRHGAEAGACRVEAVGPRQATCLGGAARPGDAARFRPAARATPAAARALPPLPTGDALAADAAAVAAVRFPAVEFRAPDRAARRPVRAAIAIDHASWVATAARGRHVESVDVRVSGAPLGAGLALDVDARAERWTGLEGARFRPGDPTRLYVWQAQVSGAWAGTPLAIAAGRVLPWNVPGATVLDGAVVSLRRGRAEAGVFGGGVPEPDTLAPTTGRATAGAFWALELRPGRLAWIRQEARLAMVRSPELGTRAELDGGGRVSLGRLLDAGVNARLGLGGARAAPGRLDGVRVDLSTRPVRALAIGGRLEYEGLEVPQPLATAAAPGRSRRADGFLALEVFRHLRVGAVAGTARDLERGADRRWYGPELVVPRLLGDRVTLAAGFLREEGWFEGRSAWVQATAEPARRVRVALRGAWSREDALGADRDALGLGGSVAAQLSPALAVRLGVDARAGGSGAGATDASAVTALAGVDARY